MRRSSKLDANHREIIDALLAVGASVLDASRLGNGAPDAIVGYRGANYLLEIKNPKTPYGKGGLSRRQKRWAAQWVGMLHVVRTIDEALQAIGAQREKQ